MSLIIVDTGVANIASVRFAFERLGVLAKVTDEAKVIQGAEKVLIPGVGAAPFAMRKIYDKGLFSVLKNLSQPVMGICLGMQLIFENLEEGGETIEGLGLIPGTIKALETKTLPSPHMGWNTLNILKDDPILHDIKANDYAYFVHSYAAKVSNATLASSDYGTEFSAIVRHKNVYGCQFHPERSSRVGAKILENFLKVPT